MSPAAAVHSDTLVILDGGGRTPTWTISWNTELGQYELVRSSYGNGGPKMLKSQVLNSCKLGYKGGMMVFRLYTHFCGNFEPNLSLPSGISGPRCEEGDTPEMGLVKVA